MKQTNFSITTEIYEGLLGALLARWVGNLNNRYLKMEANGLKSRCTQLLAKSSLEYHEAR